VGVEDREDDTDGVGEEMGKLGIVDSAPEVILIDRSRYSPNFTRQLFFTAW